MINLIIKPYCHNCPEFEATKDLMRADSFDNRPKFSTFICCKHKDRCESIAEYLKGGR